MSPKLKFSEVIHNTNVLILSHGLNYPVVISLLSPLGEKILMLKLFRLCSLTFLTDFSSHLSSPTPPPLSSIARPLPSLMEVKNSWKLKTLCKTMLDPRPGHCCEFSNQQGNMSHYYIDRSVLLENTPLVKFIRNYIRDPSGVFSISSLVRILMTSFPALSRPFGAKWRAIDLSI